MSGEEKDECVCESQDRVSKRVVVKVWSQIGTLLHCCVSEIRTRKMTLKWDYNI